MNKSIASNSKLLKYSKRKYKKQSWRIQEKRMDILFAILIKLKANLQCQRCKRQYFITNTYKIPAGLQCSHRFSRSHRNTRWSYDNCFSMCGGCHQYLDANKEIYDEWLLEQAYHTVDSLIFLKHKAHNVFKGDRSLIEIWITQELMIILPKYQQLNYKDLKPIYEKLKEIK